MFYRSVKFVDDRWLALVHTSRTPGIPPSLVLLNTDQTMTDDPTLAQTTFHFDPDHSGANVVQLNLDEGGHEPSLEESSFAPFYQAASQRMLAIDLRRCNLVFVVKIDALLRLAEEWGGTDLQWGQWKVHTVEVQLGDRPGVAVWISGPRLFCTYRTDGIWQEVYDFSPRASARRMETTTDRDGVVRQLVRQPNMQKLRYVSRGPPCRR